MLRILSILSYFLKELIFDSEDEYDINSSNFNMRKVALFALLTLSIAVNIFLLNRTVVLASEIVKLSNEKEKVNSGAVKNPKPVPSDSGIVIEKPLKSKELDSPSVPQTCTEC